MLFSIVLELSFDIHTGVTEQGEERGGKNTQTEKMLGKSVHLPYKAVLEKLEETTVI